MSCVAEARATSSAHSTSGCRPLRGSSTAMPTRPAAIASCDSSSQLRRLPISCVRPGRGTRSTSGAHTHLKPYARPTQLRWPMVLRSTPASRRRKLSVPSTSKSGRPAAKPRASMRRLAGSRYTASAARQRAQRLACAAESAAGAVAGRGVAGDGEGVGAVMQRCGGGWPRISHWRRLGAGHQSKGSMQALPPENWRWTGHTACWCAPQGWRGNKAWPGPGAPVNARCCKAWA